VNHPSTTSTESVPGPRGAERGSALADVLVRSIWRLRVHGAGHVPPFGPVIVAANHLSNLDGPLLFGASPRPLHVLVKSEAFVPPLSWLLHAVGQVPVSRWSIDRTAIDVALAVLARGDALGMFPEGSRGDGEMQRIQSGIAYLALRSGAAVVPVALLGSRPDGGGIASLPLPGRRLDVVFGRPHQLSVGGPRSRSAVTAATTELRAVFVVHVRDAAIVSGHALPRPRGTTGSVAA
jgi:1-acyl-sn-glycerol-3-phosphate acyltransferase